MELRDYQKECKQIIDNLEGGAHLIRLATGLGKCFAKGTKIRMYDGSVKNVENIVVGDKIMGWDSTPRTVTSTTSGVEDMVTISRNGYDDYTVNLSHILCLKVINPEGVIDNKGVLHKDFIDIEVSDYLKCSDEFKNGTRGYAVSWHYNIKPSKTGYFAARFKYSKQYYLQIPDKYKTTALQTRLDFLAGFLDAEGKYKNGKIIYTTFIFENAKQIIEMVRSCGIRCRIETVHMGGVNNECCEYIVVIEDSDKLIPVNNNRRYGCKKNEYIRLLTHQIEIKEVGVGEYFGFTLAEDDPDRKFLLDDGTVVHNTVIFTSIERKGRVLVLAHREELVDQPVQYYDCKVGIEQGTRRSHGEEVVIASVQSLIRRLDKFKPDDFDTIITDECHHAAAPTYKKIYNYFQPRLHLGFTATPNRGDGVRLDDVYEDIIFDRDLRWGILNGYLANIECYRADIGFDLSKVRRRMGDYAQNELEEAINITHLNKAIAEAYYNYAKGQTLIFATSVSHAFNIAKHIKCSYVVTADTKNRDKIIEKFKQGKIKVLINVMVFTEGTDLPNIETIIIARPTQNPSLYTQMVGRGLRICEGKDKLRLIDCVGVSGKHDLCTAPTLLGLDMRLVPTNKKNKIVGDLLSLENKILQESDVPESWIKNMELVDIWARERSYDTRGINWFRMPNGDFVCSLPGNAEPIVIKAPDELGKTVFNGISMDIQEAFDKAYEILKNKHSDCEKIWNLKKTMSWGSQPATEKQLEYIKTYCPDFKTKGISRFEASQILNRVFALNPVERKQRLSFDTNNEQTKKNSYRYVSVEEMVKHPAPEEYVVVHLYTTGPDPNKDIVKNITALKVQNGKEVMYLDIVINSIKDKIETGNKKLEKKAKNDGRELYLVVSNQKDAFKQLDSFIGRLPIVGHQVQYALNFFQNEFKNKNNFALDTMALAKYWFPDRADYSLKSMEIDILPPVFAQNPRQKKLMQVSALLQELCKHKK